MTQMTCVAMAALAILVVALVPSFVAPASAEDEKPAAGPRAFETPEALVEALIEAAKNNSDEALRALAGPQDADLIQPGGDPSVAKVRAEFAENAAEFWKLEANEDGSKTIVLGDSRWPFPIPLVLTASGWVLDVPAGREEILARRIGRNELNAIELIRLVADAQTEYASKDRDGDGVREFAQKIRSEPGAMDGLYWETVEGGDVSPLGPLVESAADYLRTRQPTDPVGGYYWRILKGQGRCAPGGCYAYVINGNMVAGHALVGFPAEYRETGVMTFIISNHGVVYEKDLGPRTADIVRGMLWFNPDASWQKVED
jgi:hypothetical protein